MRAGQAVIELLKIEQVRHVFGIVGSTFLDVLDVLYDDKSVEYINVRHEQGAAFMADGLAACPGLPAACLVTAGPGATISSGSPPLRRPLAGGRDRRGAAARTL